MEKTIRVAKGKKSEFMVLVLTEETVDLKIYVEEGASLDLLCLQTAPRDRHMNITQECEIQGDATLHLRNITLGGAEIDHRLVSRVEGRGSISTIDWIFYGKDQERQTLSARNIFNAENGRGEITVHGVAEGHARTAFEGYIEITEQGKGTDTYLTEKTLMLDPTAKVDAIPGLEIRTNDVKASHSASVSKVSEEDLFYFASRGIEENLARSMYVEGFLGALVETIPDSKLREKIMAEITEKYEKAR